MEFETCSINLYCPTGSSDEVQIKVTNDSPLPVFYNIRWVEESFSYEILNYDVWFF